MEVPSESFHRSSWDSRTCYPRRAFNQGLSDDKSASSVRSYGSWVSNVLTNLPRAPAVGRSFICHTATLVPGLQHHGPLSFTQGPESSERRSLRTLTYSTKPLEQHWKTTSPRARGRAVPAVWWILDDCPSGRFLGIMRTVQKSLRRAPTKSLGGYQRFPLPSQTVAPVLQVSKQV